MTTKHAPGPWRVEGDGYIRAANKSPVCVTFYDGDDVKEWANAELLAAAPELLCALERAVCDLELAHGGRDTPTLRKARAAIAKATQTP